MTIRIKRTVELTETEDGAVLLDTVRGVYWHLDGVGVQFIIGIREGKSFDQVVTLIATDYGVDRERVRHDVDGLVRNLKKARLIEESNE